MLSASRSGAHLPAATPHTLRVRRNVVYKAKFALSPEQPAAASSARIAGRQAGSVKVTFDIRLVRSAMVSGRTRMLGAASVELGGPTDLLAPNGRAPKKKVRQWIETEEVYAS